MKIEDVKLHKVVVPVKPDTFNSPSIDDNLCAPDPITGRVLSVPEFPKWIVELIADNGLTGLGEPRRGDLDEPLKECAEMIIGKSVIDLPIGNLPLPHGDAYESYFIYEAYEMAWYDLLGKHLGVPVWHLLGGKRIDRVPVDYWMGRCTVEDTARRTEMGLELGYQGIKMKCKLGDPVVERVRAIREVAPHFSIVIDPNGRLETPAETIKISKAMESFDRVILESPVPQDRLDWYVELRGKIPHQVALHLSSFSQLLPALRADAADCYNLLGPLFEFAEWARFTEAAGNPTWRGTGLDLGIRDMSSVHAAAAAGLTLPSDIIGHQLREDDLIVDPIQVVDGCAVVPDAPGLGVELDREAVKRYAVNGDGEGDG